MAVRAYPRHEPPVTAFVNGTPEPRTASAEEYFQVAAPHENTAVGRAAQWYRTDGGRRHALPGSRVFYVGQLAVGPHQVAVRTADRRVPPRSGSAGGGPAAADSLSAVSAQVILAVVRGQQLARGLSHGRGANPDAPDGLSKVTATT